MGKFIGKFMNSFITIVAVLSIFVIFVLILFSDKILAVKDTDIVLTSDSQSIKVTFDSDPLIMDGTNVDLMQGVTAVDGNGKDISDKVSASVVNGNNKKNIIYSVNGSDYDLETFQREIKLEDYKGPSILIKEGEYSCNINDIESYISKLTTSGAITADDGYGNDISSEIHLSSSNTIEGTGIQVVELMVKNKFDDTAKTNMNINVTGKYERPTGSSVNANSGQSSSSNGAVVSSNGSGTNITISADEPGKSDVPTGDNSTKVLIFSIPVLMAMTLLIFLYRKKKDN